MVHHAVWQEEYEKYFYGSPGWIDGTQEFHQLCARVIRPHSQILEVGAGPTNATSQFLSTLGELSGLDPDPDVLGNTALAHAKVLKTNQFPFANESFDSCVSNYVVEHVEDPDQHLAEVRRILRPGGAYLFRTVNRYHYIGIVASVTPHWVHRAVSNRARGLPDDAHDPYPTKYAMNSARAIRRSAARSGFQVELLRFVEKEPSYGRFSRVAYLVFTAYERLVNSSEHFAGARANLFVVLRRDEVARPVI